MKKKQTKFKQLKEDIKKLNPMFKNLTLGAKIVNISLLISFLPIILSSVLLATPYLLMRYLLKKIK